MPTHHRAEPVSHSYVQHGNTMRQSAPQPVVQREEVLQTKVQPEPKGGGIDIFDIPAFLRKQAD